MNRFKLVDAGLQRLNNQGKNVGSPIDLESQQGDLLLKLLDDPNKQDYELVEASRMAGDVDISGLLASLEGDVALEKALADAEVYIDNRAPDLQKLGLTKGGKSLGEAEERLLENGQMRGNVPMPMIEQLPSRERRTHLQNEINPVTGEIEKVAFMDPMNRDKVMRSEFGVTPTQAGRPEIMQADELASEYALKLMHKNVQNMPHKRWNEQRKVTEHPADFVVINQNGIRRNVDGEQGTAGATIIPMQTHTEVAGLSNGSVADIGATQRMIDAELASGSNIFEAVDNLAARNVLASPLATLSGKVIRGDSSRPMHLNDRYHDLIKPEYPDSVRNAEIGQQPRNMVIAPDSFTNVNLDLAAQAIKEGQGSHPRVGRNAMGSGKGHKINVGVPRMAQVGGQNVFTDLTVSNPMVQQLLSHSEMKKRGV